MNFFTIYEVQIFSNKKIYQWTIDINKIKRKLIHENEPFGIRTIIINPSICTLHHHHPLSSSSHYSWSPMYSHPQGSPAPKPNHTLYSFKFGNAFPTRMHNGRNYQISISIVCANFWEYLTEYRPTCILDGRTGGTHQEHIWPYNMTLLS